MLLVNGESHLVKRAKLKRGNSEQIMGSDFSGIHHSAGLTNAPVPSTVVGRCRPVPGPGPVP